MRPLGLTFCPPTPSMALGREARGLVWRPRAVPRTHGTREAPGPRSGGTTAALRGARCTIRGANAADGNAAPGTEIATSGAPRGERVLARRAPRKRHLDAPVGAPLPSLLRGEEDERVRRPKIANGRAAEHWRDQVLGAKRSGPSARGQVLGTKCQRRCSRRQRYAAAAFVNPIPRRCGCRAPRRQRAP
jgi:hypothetical protein